MRFVKIPAIFSTVADLNCIRKRIFNGTGFSNKIIKKNVFLTMHLFFMLLSLQFNKSPTMFSLKISMVFLHSACNSLR